MVDEHGEAFAVERREQLLADATYHRLHGASIGTRNCEQYIFLLKLTVVRGYVHAEFKKSKKKPALFADYIAF